MPDKKVPKIRFVTPNEKSPAKKGGKQLANCPCEVAPSCPLDIPPCPCNVDPPHCSKQTLTCVCQGHPSAPTDPECLCEPVQIPCPGESLPIPCPCKQIPIPIPCQSHPPTPPPCPYHLCSCDPPSCRRVIEKQVTKSDCSCDSDSVSSSSNLQSGNDQKKQQSPKKSKGEHRTFFKIAGTEKDYYPLLPGLIREYRLHDIEGDKTVKCEVLTVSQEGVVTHGRCKRTENGPNGEKVTSFTVTVRSDGIFVEGVMQFPLPLEIGRKWHVYPDGYEISSLTGAIETPAGTFKDCLRITCLIAGGDAGCGESFYAPGIGLAYESRSEESGDSYELELISYTLPAR